MKVLAGRLAAHLGTAAITDVIEFERPGLPPCTSRRRGPAQSKTSTAIYTVGAGVFDGASASGTDAVREAPFAAPARALRVTGERRDLPSDVDLAAAGVVVAGGRGFAEEADLQLMRGGREAGRRVRLLASAGRRRGWMPREAYIGVSGMMLAPKVYRRHRHLRPDAAHSGREPRGHGVRREQGQNAPYLQAVRLRPWAT